MKRANTQKGITLIALIITIVVLLILAVVAIRAVQDDGIIAHAKNARDDYQKAQDEEQTQLQNYLDKIKEEVGNSSEETTGKWTQNGLTVTDGTTTLTVGDTVDYTPGEGSTYTGAWKVLGAENGELLIMTDGYVNSSFSLNGSTGWDTETQSYKAQIEALDAECANKVKIEGTKATKVRSVKVEDINKVTGYDPTNQKDGKPYGSGNAYQYGNEVTYTLTADGKVAYSSDAKSGTSTYTSFTMPDGTKLAAADNEANKEKKEIKLKSDVYSYGASTYLTDTSSNAYKLLFGNDDTYYWLGSSYVDTYAGYADFGLRNVDYGFVNGCYLWYSNGGGSCYDYGVRAVVSLESDVKLTSSGDSSWTLSK